jgi:hypothetical protein
VLSIETGEVTELQGAIANYNESSYYQNGAGEPAPSWRYASELCYIVAPGNPTASPRRAEVVLRACAGTAAALLRGTYETHPLVCKSPPT